MITRNQIFYSKQILLFENYMFFFKKKLKTIFRFDKLKKISNILKHCNTGSYLYITSSNFVCNFNFDNFNTRSVLQIKSTSI